MDSNPNDAVLIERGNAAEQLKNDIAFASLSNELVNFYISSFANSTPTDKDAREVAYYGVKAVQDMVGLLNQWIVVRDQVIESINFNNQEDN